MRVSEMTDWLMNKGFSVEREYNTMTRMYTFRIEKNGYHMRKEFAYPNDITPAALDECQRCFLEDLVREFDFEYYRHMDVASLYPKTMINYCYGMTSYGRLPQIENVIFNGPATIVLWSDGTKTVVKAQDGEVCDREKGLAMAISKRALGNKGNYYNTFSKWLKEYEEE